MNIQNTTKVSSQAAGLLRQALFLEYLTIGWNIVEAAIALFAGWRAGSIALIGFGLDSVIEVTAATAVFWRLQGQLCSGKAQVPHAERAALRVVGTTFFLLAFYVGYQAIGMLMRREAPQASLVGIVLAMVSAALMPWLWQRKCTVAKQIKSKALAADAVETLICGLLSVALLAGLVLNAWLGWWWADPAAALIMLPLIINEGWETWHESNGTHGVEHE